MILDILIRIFFPLLSLVFYQFYNRFVASNRARDTRSHTSRIFFFLFFSFFFFPPSPREKYDFIRLIKCDRETKRDISMPFINSLNRKNNGAIGVLVKQIPRSLYEFAV